MLLVQSALCAKVQELTLAETSLARHRQALEEQIAAAEKGIHQSRQELAALRYAVLDGSRGNSHVNRIHTQTVRQSATSLSQVISALLSSPLSLAQRRLATSVQGAQEGWMKSQLESLSALQPPISAPVFQAGEFNLAEVTQGPWQTIQRRAAAAGIQVQTAISPSVPEKIIGEPRHIGQLLTLLPEALARQPETSQLCVEVSVDPILPGSARLSLELEIAVKGAASELCERFTAIAAASGTLQTAQLAEVEADLAVCWQLAQALGGTVDFHSTSEKNVRLQVVLPVEIPSSPGPSETAACVPEGASCYRAEEPT